MNYETRNNFAAAICGIQPARIIAAGAHKEDNKQMARADLKGLFEYKYIVDDLTIQCFLEYEEAERETRDCPGQPESITLIHALVNGVDVACILSDEQVEEIELEAGVQMAVAASDAEYDRGEDLYNDRMGEAA